MPSQKLDLLCQQIENQATDDFGKFYMYVSLLKSVAIRNTTFASGLPKYNHGMAFWKKNYLDLGELPKDFSDEVAAYAREFINTEPNVSNLFYNIAMTYIRKGNIADLIYIIDKMLSHLNAINGTQSHNQEISNHIDFIKKKSEIAKFIEQISSCNQQLLSTVDSTCNAALFTGATLLLTFIFSLAPSLLVLGLMAGGAYNAYSYAMQAYSQGVETGKKITLLGEKLKSLPLETSLLSDKNHNRFFTAIITPLPHAAITAGEQLAPNKSWLDTTSKWHEQVDRTCSLFIK
jgi:hypothetical protein